MRLLNLSTGIVRTQTIDGEAVRTAYVKTPVPEPWLITPTGPAGDEVAAHTDHLYAFDRRSYDFWASELGVRREDWRDGFFAENLTLDVLDQSDLRIGDTFRLGTALIVVTGPRVPCWKLTWRLGQPKTFMRRFRLSGHSGSYFGVLEPGIVGRGDELAPVSRAPSAPSVAELSRLCDSGTRITVDDRSVIERALASRHLSRTVRDTLDLKLAALEREAAVSAGAWKGWRRFDVSGVAPETSDSSSFRLRPADAGPLPGFVAGQHLVVRLTAPGEDAVVRTWSLSAHDPAPEEYRITVRVRADGRGSGLLTRADRDGLVVELRSPAGRFRLDQGSFRPVVLVAAGIGITPMMAMMQAHLARGDGMPPLWVLYGSTTPEQTAFRTVLDEASAQNRDVNLHYFYSRVPDLAEGVGLHRGRITAERIVEVLRGNYLRTPDGPADIPWFESDIYICGPVEFTDTLREELVLAGANPDLVFVEDFLAAGEEAVIARRRTDAVVRYEGRGLEAIWRPDEEQTLLELAEDGGLDLPYECRAGTCRTCESRLVSGEIDGPVAIGTDGSRRILPCISYPFSDRVVVQPPEG